MRIAPGDIVWVPVDDPQPFRVCGLYAVMWWQGDFMEEAQRMY